MNLVDENGRGAILRGLESESVASLGGLNRFYLIFTGSVPPQVRSTEIQAAFEARLRDSPVRIAVLGDDVAPADAGAVRRIAEQNPDTAVITVVLNSFKSIPVGPGLFVVSVEVFVYQMVRLERDRSSSLPAATWITSLSGLASGRDVDRRCLELCVDCADMLVTAYKRANP